MAATIDNREPGRRREADSSRHRVAAWLAWSVWALCVALTASGLWLLNLNLTYPGVDVFDYWVEDAVLAVVCSTVGAAIASRRSTNPIGWIFCAIGLIAGVDQLCAQYATLALLAEPGMFPGGEVLAWVRSWIWVPHIGLFLALGLLFPNGKLPSSRWRPVAWISALLVLTGAVVMAFSPGPIDGLEAIRNPLKVEPFGIVEPKSTDNLVDALLFVLVLVVTGSLFARMRRARGAERQQIKWFAYAATVAGSTGIVYYVVSEVTGTSVVSWASFVPLIVALAGLPIAVGIAIHKYHLYDIDHIINRTLVYGSLTALLASAYVGSVALLHGIVSVILHVPFRALTGQDSSMAIVVASTLLMATLFNPLRRRIQGFIDRRFYRRKYDARKTLEAFSATLKDETDLEALNDELVGVVRETMQPAHVGFWVRPPIGVGKVGGEGREQ
jgi:uncharacterized membrane protein SirB2